jgi:hypothetical protein
MIGRGGIGAAPHGAGVRTAIEHKGIHSGEYINRGFAVARTTGRSWIKCLRYRADCERSAARRCGETLFAVRSIVEVALRYGMQDKMKRPQQCAGASMRIGDLVEDALAAIASSSCNQIHPAVIVRLGRVGFVLGFKAVEASLAATNIPFRSIFRRAAVLPFILTALR